MSLQHQTVTEASNTCVLLARGADAIYMPHIKWLSMCAKIFLAVDLGFVVLMLNNCRGVATKTLEVDTIIIV